MYMRYNIEEIKRKLKKYGQEHLLNFYDNLDERKQEELLEQIERIDFERCWRFEMPEMWRTVSYKSCEII